MYNEIYKLFGEIVLNTNLYKEMSEISLIHGYKKMLAFINSNYETIEKALNKSFSTEYLKIRYFSAIIKNGIGDFKEEKEFPLIPASIDIIEPNYRHKKRKKSLSEFEKEMSDSH